MDSVAAKPQEIVLYGITDLGSWFCQQYVDEFKKHYPIVTDIYWLERHTPELWSSTVLNSSVSFDLLWGQTPDNVDLFVEQGIISPIQNQTINDYLLNVVPETFAKEPMYRVDENGNILWVTTGISSAGLMINHDNLERYGLPIPCTWEELASPDYYLNATHQAIGMGETTSSTATRIYQIILQTFGWEAGWDIITRMAANSQIFPNSNDLWECTTIDQAISISSDYWGYDIQGRYNSCEYILPTDESIIDGIPIAVASSSEGEERVYAEKFIEFVLSPEAQGLWLDLTIEKLPILKEGFDHPPNGIPRPDMQTSWERIRNSGGIDFNESLANAIYDSVIWYFQGTFTETMEELYSAWKTIINAYNNKEISEEEYRSLCREMSDPSISLDEARTVALEIQENANVTDEYIQQWKQDALSRYQNISGKVKAEKTDMNNDGSLFNEFAIEIISPISGSDVEGIVEIRATVVDYGDWSFLYGVTNVEFWVDGNLLANNSVADFKDNGLSIFTTEWNTNEYSVGSHNLTVIAKEYNGRTVRQESQVDVSIPTAFFGVLILLGVSSLLVITLLRQKRKG